MTSFDESAPGLNAATADNSAVIAELIHKRARALRWLYICLLLIPVGFAVPFMLIPLVPPGNAAIILLLAAFLLPCLPFAFIPVMIYRRFVYKRSIALAHQADLMRMRFSPDPPAAEFAALKSLQRSKQGHHFGGRNMITGVAEDSPVYGIDFSFYEGYGRSQRRYGQTIVVLPEVVPDVPNFVLTPKGWFDKFSNLFGFLIELPDQPEFNRKFALRGKDRDAIQPCFSPNVIEVCLRHPQLTTEVKDGMLAVFHFNKKLVPDLYPERIDHALRLAEALRDAIERAA